jgi:hypothetical protein
MTARRTAAALVALILAAAGTAVPAAVAQEDGARAADTQAMGLIPPSGIGATTTGERVLLLPDGTWRREGQVIETVDAITDTGRQVELRQVTEADGDSRLTWDFIGAGGGPIQIVVTRALNTALSVHSKEDNCIPAVAARNLSSIRVNRVLVEIAFSDPEGNYSFTSLMMGPLDHGDAHEVVSPPLFFEACRGLTGTLTVPYCELDGGTRCDRLVVASDRGVIPLSMETERASTGNSSPDGADAPDEGDRP